MDARLYVLYLLALAVGVFWLQHAPTLAGLVALQAVLCRLGGLPWRRLARKSVKLSAFALFVTGTYAFTAIDPQQDRWWSLAATGLRLNVYGMEQAGLMLLRIGAIVLASELVRVLRPEAIAAGLRGLGLGRTLAFTVDTVLALLATESERGRGRGRGGRRRQARRLPQASTAQPQWDTQLASSIGAAGPGPALRRAGDESSDDLHAEGGAGIEASPPGPWHGFKRVLQGDLGFLRARLEQQIRRAGQHAARSHSAAPQDAVVVAGIALSMLGIKALKLLPAIPFAPGHKLVLLTPLYIAATQLTQSRFGATAAGSTLGIVSFLLGDGRYGIFELAKHITPGLLCDAIAPWLLRQKSIHAAVWTLVGGLLALARFGTILLVVALVQAPALAYAILLPGLSVHLSFGLLSGYVSHFFVRALRVDLDAATG
ncbi:MAG: hypothetical protein ACPGUV_02565 [Polyangiales bacterium]